MKNARFYLTIVSICFINFTSAQNWIIETIASMGPGTSIGNYCTIAIDSENVIHISHYDLTNENLLYTTNYSGSWTTEVVDSEGRVGEYCAIAVDSDNKPHICYFEWIRNDSIPYADTVFAFSYGNLKYAVKDGEEWLTIVIDTAAGLVPRICIDNLDKVHIVHTKSGFNVDDVVNIANTKYTTNSSGEWISTPIAAQVVKGADASIIADSDNKIHIALHNQEGAGTSAEGPMGGLRYLTNKTGVWELYDVDSSESAGNDTQIALDNDDNIHISYIDKEEGLKYATNKTGDWEYTVVDNNYNVGWNSSIVVDSSNGIHISYSDPIFLSTPPGNGYLKYAYSNGENWDYMIVDSNNAGMFTFIALDINQSPHIAYTSFVETTGSGVLNHAYIQDVQSNSAIKLYDKFFFYPNPAKDYFQIELSDDENFDNKSLKIYDLTGKDIFYERINNRNSITINSETWRAGLYFVSIVDGDRIVVSERIIIQ